MNHRRSTARPPWLIPLLCVGAMLATVAVFSAVAGSNYDKAAPEITVGTVTDTVSADPLPPDVVRVTPNDVRRARQGKPLQDLVPGDRVLYDARDERPVCLFLEWFGSISQARIKCKGLPQLTVETGFLTPVETLD